MNQDLSLRSLLSNSVLAPAEAKILMAYVLEKYYQLPRSALLSRDDLVLNAKALEEWKMLESKRIQGEPIAYLIGKRGFHNIELYVAPGVLIPRPETELLVEIGLREITRLNAPTNILDLGTGSGAIALAIAHEAPDAQLTATDQAIEALDIAKINAKLLNMESRVQFFQGSWYEAIEASASYDVILSNPPYITSQDSHLSQGDLRFEPISALTDHGNGLTCLESIISGAKHHLNPNGLLAVEHGFNQSEAVVALMQQAGFQDVQAHLDLGGHYRVASGRK
ncbi:MULTISPECIES: peptide chain release factor N(5)-glutamine methyltransferase [unclassified Polynucleobacter]|uniref:peptide chain release factor N(5)-glutamine methyltransferase n=1 Tax=Polynucleobacter sp. AP-RePozz3-80-G7 TaxID=2689105 RepID=UPI001BFDBF24|nr:peptide chain release factor N(5)-glutamine methyltransferase [Polynucleobacter sp. AP-RePozz3-80-G7]QWD81751.1 peptide chain release factor N(5)-glutamine methyltransferase [Polynucleobacter sp. MWH-S4W17]